MYRDPRYTFSCINLGIGSDPAEISPYLPTVFQHATLYSSMARSISGHCCVHLMINRRLSGGRGCSRTTVRRVILVLSLCQVIWSFGGVVIQWTPLSATTLMPLVLLASGALLAAMTPGYRLRLPSWRLRGEAVAFGVANGLTNILSAVAITMAGVGNASFAFASLPLWLVIVARPLVGDRVPTRVIPALGLGAAGIGLLLLSGRGSDSGDRVFLGLLVGVLAAVIGSVSALAGRRLVPKIGVDATAAWTMFAGGLVLTPLIDWSELGLLAWWMVPVLLLWTLAHFVLAPVLYNRSSIVAPAFVLAIATFVNPSAAPIWGAIFYGERVAPLAVAGLALALGANILLLVLMRGGRTIAEIDVPASDAMLPSRVVT
jgi:drug/metabolite transporter (DMT)-like permease